jgi:hypothetical protein
VLPDDTFNVDDLLIVVGDVDALSLVRKYAKPDTGDAAV